MNALLEWLKTWDWNALLATIIAFGSVHAGSILLLVIGLIKTRIRKFNFQEALEKKSQDDRKAQQENMDIFQQKMLSRLDEIEKNIIQKNNEANQERLKILKDALEDADKVTAEVQAIPVEETKDANSILNEVGD